MSPSLEPTIQLAKFKKTKCSYSEAATPQTKDIMTHITSSCVNHILISANFQWYQPPNQKSVGPPKNAMSKIGGP